MSERVGIEFLSDEQLLEEIKRQWYHKGQFDYELMQMDEKEAFSPANDYMSSDIEEHITKLEQEYRKRGFELPSRWEYVNQFMPDDEDEESA